MDYQGTRIADWALASPSFSAQRTGAPYSVPGLSSFGIR